jgi:hypothetical protein
LLAEYAPVVTLVAVIGAYFAADGCRPAASWRCSCSACTRQQGIFGFKMEAGEAQSSTNSCDHRVHHAPVHFHPARRAGRFRLMSNIWLGGVAVVTVLMLVARPATVFLCACPTGARDGALRDAVHVLDARDRRHPGGAGRPLLGMKAPGAQMIASVTFIAILMTILIQAPTTEWLGRRLGLWRRTPGRSCLRPPLGRIGNTPGSWARFEQDEKKITIPGYRLPGGTDQCSDNQSERKIVGIAIGLIILAVITSALSMVLAGKLVICSTS